MNITSDLLARGWAAPLLDFVVSSRTYARVAFVGAGLRFGVLRALGSDGLTARQLAGRLNIDSDGIAGLTAWLDLGVSLGVLKRRGLVYTVGSRRAKALLKPGNDAIAAFYEEYVELDHALIVEAIPRLAGDRPFELTGADAEIIARSSRLSEPWITATLKQVVPTSGLVKVVEVGCGSGVHMRTAARLNPQARIRGLDLQVDAAEQARANIARWELSDRISVEVGDVRDLAGTGDADLLTLHQNIYYFPADERASLLRHLRSFLAPGGRILVTTLARGRDANSGLLHLWGALTRGTSGLPTRRELGDLLAEAGFVDVHTRTVGPGGLYIAGIGRAPQTSGQ